MLAWACAAAAVLWCVVLVSGPSWPGALAGPLYAFGALICHQRPERSFQLAAGQIPVCARCLGLYAGAAIGAVAGASIGLRWLRPDGTWWGLRGRAALVASVAAVPTVVTVAWEWVGLGDTSNASRAAAGVLLGAGLGVVVIAALRADGPRPSLLH